MIKYYAALLKDKEGHSNISIAEELKISRHTVKRWIKRYEDTNTITRQSGSGRNKKTTDKEDDRLIDLLKENRYLTSNNIKDKLNKEGIIISEKNNTK